MKGHERDDKRTDTIRLWLAVLLVVTSAALLGLAFWDWEYAGQLPAWLRGERVYAYYWRQLAIFILAAEGIALSLWFLARKFVVTTSVVPKATKAAATDAILPSFWTGTKCFWPAFLVVLFFLRYRVHLLGVEHGSSIWTYWLLGVTSAVAAPLLATLLHSWNLKFLPRSPRLGWYVVATLAVIYFLTFTTLACARHANFRTHALDTGTMDQAAWNTIHGRILERTPLEQDPQAILYRDNRLVDGKLEVLFIAISALYWLWADPRLLFIVQTAFLAAGAMPLYILARDKTNSPLSAVALTAAYLVYLPLHYITMFEFHPSVLMVPFLFLALLGMERRSWPMYWLGLALALTCRVDAALAGLTLGVYLILARQRRQGLLTLAVCLAWLVLDFNVITPWVKQLYSFRGQDLLARRFGETSGGPWGLIVHFLTHPTQFITSLLDREKLQTVFDLFMPLGFLPLLSPGLILPAIPILIINLLAESEWQSTIHAHYMAPVLPFLFAATASTIGQLGRRWKRQPITRFLASFVFINTLLVTIFFSPYPPGKLFHWENYYQPSSYEENLQRIIALVPSEATVCAQSDIFPHLSHRQDIYLFPFIADAEYVIVDLDATAEKSPSGFHTFYAQVNELLENPEFGVIAQAGGVLLFRRGADRSNLPVVRQALDAYGRDFYRVAFLDYRVPAQLRADELYRVQVTIQNTGSQCWWSHDWYPVRLTYRWLRADGQAQATDAPGLRTDMPHIVKPGTTITLRPFLLTPPQPGTYILEWDLVREDAAWFSDQGAATLRLAVEVK
ncbi:MAG: DUF2079 domain-containing protein [Anaerolineae bacterium]|jgi:uncharacterized membrane protein|nr:DUF2079 domain-containing protein [Anaerolineae bacterium]MDH7474918.1 DUF2079 domain-containing protein [Anaerolineae bacterium]